MKLTRKIAVLFVLFAAVIIDSSGTIARIVCAFAFGALALLAICDLLDERLMDEEKTP